MSGPVSGPVSGSDAAWEALNRRLVGALLALDFQDVLTIGERLEPAPRRGLLRRRAPSGPRRFVAATAGQTVLVLEVVGSTSFGGAWPMTPEQEQRLERAGWERPWNEDLTTWMRDLPALDAPRAALALVRALQVLDLDVDGLEFTLSRDEE